MPKPRVFVSSTFYDLKHIRASLEIFIEQLGFEPVLSEKGSIAYDPDVPLDESCYREVGATDIFVLIVGGRYGSEVSGSKTDRTARKFADRFESITKREYETSIERDIPTYILVEKAVYAEYQTYKNNRENETIRYVHVDSVNVFRFLDSILARPRNNPTYQFERHTDIQAWLREQWAGLFRDLLSRRTQAKQLASLGEQVAELSSLSATLKRYLEALVSKVGGSTQTTEKLIETEERRLDADRRKRAALKLGMLSQLRDVYEVPEDKVLSIYSDATSIDDLVRRVAEATNGAVDSEVVLSHWRKSPEIVAKINRARELLRKPPLEFLKPLDTPRVSKPKKRRSR
jgi:hypothetical protein